MARASRVAPAHDTARAPLRWALAAASCAAATIAPAYEPSSAPIVAERAPGPIRIDGRLDEPAWAAARPWSGFVQIFPRAGESPSERTEVRFLYDAATIYVGITCRDTRADEIGRPLSRRDSLPPGDKVRVALDSLHDRRNGYSFGVSAGGVLEDRILFDDAEDSKDWDAVWEGAAAKTPDGWTAELAIPLAELRMRGGGPQTFGIYVERTIGRTHEVIGSALIPSSAGAFVSMFGDLELGPVAPPLGIEVTPFLAARVVAHPQFSDRALPRLVDPSADLGFDLRAPLGPGLTLTGTVNPDFGQVEADPVILNLTRFEPFFPEKRPFFLKDLDLFVPPRGGDSPQQILYTRRIGLTAPILGAAKVSGEATPGWQLGMLDAVVVGAGAAPGDEAHPDRRVQFHPAQPLRIGPNSALPAEAPAPRNFLAGTLRRPIGDASSAGVSLASATPLGGTCSAEDEARSPPPDRCTPGGNVLAADLELRPVSVVTMTGQIAMSQAVGGPSSRTLPDGTELRHGELGVGSYGLAGKTGGEPIQADLGWEYASPAFDVNATGFQPDQNVVAFSPSLRFVRAAEGFGDLRSFSARLSGRGAWSSDGRRLLREARGSLDVAATLPTFHELDCGGDVFGWAWDLREIVGTGIAYERPARAAASCTVTTDQHRPAYLQVSVDANRVFTAGLVQGAGPWGGSAQAVVYLRPLARAETRVGVQLGQKIVPGRFIDEANGTLRFGDLLSRSLTVKLRQEVLVTRDLSLQVYAELFSALGRYKAYYTAPEPPDARLFLRELEPTPAPAEALDFRLTSLRANAVLRWEYRPGSTLFVVYAHQQDGSRSLDPRSPIDLSLGPLAHAPATDVFLVKVSLWSVR
jgi:hypothetical protein